MRAALALVPIALALALPARAEQPAADSGSFSRLSPVLTDPRGALKDALALREQGQRLKAADIELLASDAREAIRTLRDFDPKSESEECRKARIELDAYVMLGEGRAALERIDILQKCPGWGPHVRKQRPRLRTASYRGTVSGIGDVVFAGALALLLLAASRELLRFRPETLMLAIAAVVAIALAESSATPLAVPLGLIAIAMLAIVHAAGGAIRRLAPGPKGRLFVVALALLGVAGSVFAVLSRIDASYLPLSFS